MKLANSLYILSVNDQTRSCGFPIKSSRDASAKTPRDLRFPKVPSSSFACAIAGLHSIKLACRRSSASRVWRAAAAAFASAGATSGSSCFKDCKYEGVGIFAARFRLFCKTIRVRSDRSHDAFCVRTATPFAQFCDFVTSNLLVSASSARTAASCSSKSSSTGAGEVIGYA